MLTATAMLKIEFKYVCCFPCAVVTVKVAAFVQIIEGTYDSYRNGGK